MKLEPMHPFIDRKTKLPGYWRDVGTLEAYWEAYEAVGLNLFTDYAYLTEVWTYHQQMVDAIVKGDYEAGYQALVKHKDLLYHRPYAVRKNMDHVHG